MAEIRKGPHKGKKLTIVQWCNDWFQVDALDGAPIKGGTIGVMNIKLNELERAEVAKSIEDGQAGRMGDWYELQDDGTFRRKERA